MRRLASGRSVASGFQRDTGDPIFVDVFGRACGRLRPRPPLVFRPRGERARLAASGGRADRRESDAGETRGRALVLLVRCRREAGEEPHQLLSIRWMRIVSSMVFIEAPAFTRHLGEYLSDDQFAAFQRMLLAEPDAGNVIQGTGGFRKVRWSDPGRGKGKRGGLRVIYYWFEADQQIWLMTIYDKSEADDLNADQKKALKSGIETELKAREKSRRRGR